VLLAGTGEQDSLVRIALRRKKKKKKNGARDPFLEIL